MDKHPIPIKDNVEDSGGFISRIWREWLRRLVQMVEDSPFENPPSPTPDVEGEAKRISELSKSPQPDVSDEIESIARDRLPVHQDSGEIEELQRQVALLSSQDHASEFEDLRRRIALLPLPEPVENKWAESGTHANRPTAAAREDGFVYFETDREVFYIAIGGTWYYVSGQMSGTLSPDQKPGDLGTADENFRFWSTDFTREYRWTGSAWADAPGAPERNQVGMFTSAPGTGWQVCDGSAGVSVSTSTGGTSTITAPDYTTAAYLKLIDSGHTLGPTAASGNVAAESAHTHSVNVPNTTSGGPSATVAVQSGAGTTVANDVHTHDTNPGSFTSGAGSSHQHGPGDLELRNTELLAYIRL